MATLQTDGEGTASLFDLAQGHRKRSEPTNPVEDLFAAVRLCTEAENCRKRVVHPAARVSLALGVAQRSFRRLEEPELLFQ